MKIYVITKGEYSAYHICAATTDKDRAELLRYMASTDGPYGEEARIEEYDDYSGLDLLQGDVYEVSILYENGVQVGVYTDKAYYIDDESLDNRCLHYEQEKIHGRIDKTESGWPGIKHCEYTAYVVASNEEKAEKIGIDMIQEYRAKEMELV